MGLLYFIVIVLFILVVWVKIRYPVWKGRSGENFVSNKLRQLDPAHYKVLSNLLLPSLGNTKTTQIDHVVVSNYGIFCVETKNYDGWIFGSAHQEYWTQVIYHYKQRFYNPLRQNYAHIKAIEALVKPLYPKATILPFVAFPSADKLKVSGTDSVGLARDVINKIKGHTLAVLSDIDRDKIYEILFNANIQDKEALKLHNQNIRNLTTSR